MPIPRHVPATRSLHRHVQSALRFFASTATAAAFVLVPLRLSAADDPLAIFHAEILPILEENCFDCHGTGLRKGGVSLDTFESDEDMLAQRDLWFAVLKNVRAGVMPPADEPRPAQADIDRLAEWITFGAFGVDRENPDPGRVTIRRLNRIEYGNTIRDLMGVEFRGDVEFPPDDTGHGFDNIGDVLSVSPLLLEKYLQAAETIVQQAVPAGSRVVDERVAGPEDFRSGGDPRTLTLRFDEAEKVSHTFPLEQEAEYRLTLDAQVRGPFDFDPSRSVLVVRLDGKVLKREEHVWHENKKLDLTFTVPLSAGEHTVEIETEPVARAGRAYEFEEAAPESSSGNQFRITAVRLAGPLDESRWVEPANYRRFFPQGAPPQEAAARDRYARECLERFATRAFRRAPDPAVVDRLAGLARSVYMRPDETFESGMARAFTAMLASPRFIFRVESPEALHAGVPSAPIDEYALASRLSYFLWSTMPDEKLFALAARRELRSDLDAQVARMLADPRAAQFVRNFTGQWLQARDVEFIPINMRAVLGITGRRPPGSPRLEFDSEIRNAMRRETEMQFERIMREDRSVLELIDSDYTYLNERLATHYGIPDIEGSEMRLVQLPPGSVRGGVLTQGTVLTVTSNPTRTSPVKRGQFILENILGTPAPPPPAEVPDLEEARNAFAGREPSLREALELHRKDALCSSCHSRMDPLGFALENFNALGMWREQDGSQPIDPSGTLITGEAFQDIREVKRIIANERRIDFYRCLAEKLLTYALGRGVEYYDVPTVDRMVQKLEESNGRFSELLHGVVNSAPFQRTRIEPQTMVASTPPASSSGPNTPQP